MFLNHRKCQKAHSGIVSSRQGLGQARTLAHFRGTTLIHRIAEHRRFQSHSGTITYTTPSQPTHHLPFYIRGNGFSCTAGQTSFQCEAPGCIHRFVSRASHQPAAFCHHVHLLLLPFKAYII